jgi:hypothetical protein
VHWDLLHTHLIEREFLTGFRKRKTQRQQKAAEHAKEQARKERIETRKEVDMIDM